MVDYDFIKLLFMNTLKRTIHPTIIKIRFRSVTETHVECYTSIFARIIGQSSCDLVYVRPCYRKNFDVHSISAIGFSARILPSMQ